MKRVAIVSAIFAVATLAYAQYSGTQQSQTPPAAQQGSAQQQTQPAPAGKRPPQAKTQAEFDAYNQIANTNDPAALEKAADDFAAKFPDSELRILLYKKAMAEYQSANNGDKMMEMGKKALAIDPNDAQALISVAEVLAERTRETDLDKDQRLAEARKDAENVLKSVDTETPAGIPPDKIELYKGLMKSNAYAILGTLDFNKNDYAAAEGNFRKSIDALPQQPDAVTVLRLALALDHQGKYPEALKYANQAVQMTQENTNAGTAARHEQDRLVKLTGGTPAGAAPTGTPAGAPAGTPNPPQTNVPPKN